MWKPRGDTRVPDPLPCTHAHTHTRMLARTHGFSPSRGLRPRLGSKPVPHYACAADPIPAPGPLPWRRSSSQRHPHSLGPARACLGRSIKHVLQEGWLSRKTLQRKRGSGCASPPLSPLRTPTLSLGHGSREASPTLGKSGVPPSPPWEPWRAALLHRGYSKRAAAPRSF